MVSTHAEVRVYSSIINDSSINASTKSQRVAEGEAILASIFGEVAIAA